MTAPNSTNIVKRSEAQRPLAYAEMDGNLQELINVIDQSNSQGQELINVIDQSNSQGQKLTSIANAQVIDERLIFESLRRSYAEAGYNLVNGSFEKGGTLTNTNDVLLLINTRIAYSYSGTLPKVVDPATDPTAVGSGYVPRIDAGLRGQLSKPDGSTLSGYKLRTVYDELTDLHNAGGYQSISECISASPDKSTVFIPSGTHTESVDIGKCDIVGDGYSTIVVPGSGYAFKMKQSVPHWERRSISHLRVSGAGGDVGFTYDPADELAGRWDLSYIGITGVGIGILKPQGNIGNSYTAINFRSVDRGYVSTDGTLGVMHSGCDRFTDCYWQGVNTWCVDITCKTDGGGQIVIADSVMEQCGGGGIRADFGGITPYTPLVIRNVWFEEIAKSATVTRNGVVETPRQIKLINTPVAFAENCYLNNIELINSNLMADGCRFDSVSTNTAGFVIDNNSSLTATNVYANGSPGINVIVKSVSRQSMLAGVGAASFRGIAPTNAMYKPVGSTAIVADSYTGDIGIKTWTFGGTQTITAHCVDDGTLSHGCAELVIPANSMQVSQIANTRSNKWYVFGVDIKVMAGQVSASFSYDTNFGAAYSIVGEWVTSFGIVKSNSASSVALLMRTTSNATVRLQNFFIVEFDSETDALAFCNSRSAINS